MTDREGESKRDDESPVDAVDAEFAGKHGTTASESSLSDEQRPELHPQTAGELGEKLKDESEGEGLGGKAKAVLQEADRQLGGEYERRENPEATGPHGEPPAEQNEGEETVDVTGAPRRTDAASARRDDRVAAPAVGAEQERFEGLVNEPGNPQREPQRLGEEPDLQR